MQTFSPCLNLFIIPIIQFRKRVVQVFMNPGKEKMVCILLILMASGHSKSGVICKMAEVGQCFKDDRTEV